MPTPPPASSDGDLPMVSTGGLGCAGYRGAGPEGAGVLAGVVMAVEVAATFGLVGHDLGGLQQGAVEPVELGEDHLGVAGLEVEQAPGFVEAVEVGQA